jgi:hypothetical protein
LPTAAAKVRLWPVASPAMRTEFFCFVDEFHDVSSIYRTGAKLVEGIARPGTMSLSRLRGRLGGGRNSNPPLYKKVQQNSAVLFKRKSPASISETGLFTR